MRACAWWKRTPGGGTALQEGIVSVAPYGHYPGGIPSYYGDGQQRGYGDYATDTLQFFAQSPRDTASPPARIPEGWAALIWQMSYARQWADVPPNVIAKLDPATQYAGDVEVSNMLIGEFLVDTNTSQATPFYPKPSDTLTEQERGLAMIQQYLLGGS